MASLFQNRSSSAQAAEYDKRMSSHLAGALVIFALLQIFVVARMGGSLLLHLGIIIAIALFATAARTLERRWVILAQSGLPSAGLATRFRIDLLQLWATSLLTPLLWIPVSVVTNFLFG
ncbi:hypothetical protein BH10PSE12_BH10PSE12_27820 [soil metagenome]